MVARGLQLGIQQDDGVVVGSQFLGDDLEGLAQQVTVVAVGGVAVAGGAGRRVPLRGGLDHVRVRRVVDHLRRLVAGQLLVRAQPSGLLEEAGLLRVADHVQVPALAGVALHVAVVADGHQQHLARLRGRHVALGIKGPVPAPGHDALAHAVLDVALRPVAVNVGQRGRRALERRGVHIAQGQDGDHLRHLGAGHALRRGIGVVAHAVDDAEARHHVHGFLVLDLRVVVVVRGGCAKGAQPEDHDERENQAQGLLQSSHVETPPLSSTARPSGRAARFIYALDKAEFRAPSNGYTRGVLLRCAQQKAATRFCDSDLTTPEPVCPYLRTFCNIIEKK